MLPFAGRPEQKNFTQMEVFSMRAVYVFLALSLLLISPLCVASEQLDTSWDKLISGLQAARKSLADPGSFPADPTDRNLAEGHRYLLGHLGRLIEWEMRSDPRFPEFFRFVDMLRKWTGENPDTKYLGAPIDAKGYYRVSGQVANHAEWSTSDRGIAGPKAPRMVIFQTTTGSVGSTGGLEEMAICKNQTLASINSFDLQIEAGGKFELLVGPEQPPDYPGNFLLSKKKMNCRATGVESVRQAQVLSVREIFSDWENERSIDMEIVRLDAKGTSRPPIDSDFMSKRLEKIAEAVPNQIRFWQLLQEFPMEMRRDVNNDGRRNMPVNDINPPAPPFTAGGVAGAGQLYAGGIFELAEDEALLVKVTSPVEPHYMGFQLNNHWLEGPDQQNFVSSLNGHQLPVASDGSRYFVVSHRDPGIQGWVDTTGLPRGSIAMRFIFRSVLPEEQLPTTKAQLVKNSALRSLLPADTAVVSSEQRQEEIAVRQSHIKRRWRGH